MHSVNGNEADVCVLAGGSHSTAISLSLALFDVNEIDLVIYEVICFCFSPVWLDAIIHWAFLYINWLDAANDRENHKIVRIVFYSMILPQAEILSDGIFPWKHYSKIQGTHKLHRKKEKNIRTLPRECFRNFLYQKLHKLRKF